MKTVTLPDPASAAEGKKNLDVQRVIQQAEECVRESRKMIAEIRARLAQDTSSNAPAELEPAPPESAKAAR
jgi:hypothetical protein